MRFATKNLKILIASRRQLDQEASGVVHGLEPLHLNGLTRHVSRHRLRGVEARATRRAILVTVLTVSRRGLVE